MFHYNRNFSIELLDINWNDTYVELIIGRIFKIRPNFVRKTLDIWIYHSEVEPIHDLILDLISKPINKLIVDEKNTNAIVMQSLGFMGLKAVEHQVVYLYNTECNSAVEPTTHWLSFSYDYVEVIK